MRKVSPRSSLQPRVSCSSFSPRSSKCTCRSNSNASARRTPLIEFMFLISIFAPSSARDFGRTETLQSQRSCPFSMSASLTPPCIRICFNEARNANASSGEWISGCVTISISGVPARLKSMPVVVSKSFHFETTTGIDFNRAGTPLMEIVTQPEIHSPDEAFAFLASLKQILIQGGVSDADMEKGQLRCDCNVSVRPKSRAELGAKIEIKNMNSISGVRRALAFELDRQVHLLERGEKLEQETRGWSDERGETFLMRTKESAHDYRYFPDPDLVPVKTDSLVAEVRSRVPELPAAKRARFVEQYQITDYDAAVLANDVDLARYFESAAQGATKPKQIANWILNDLQSALSAANKTINDCAIPPEALRELVGLIDSGRISGKQAKDVFADMFASGKSAGEVVRTKGIEQLSDTAALEKMCDEVITANPKPAAD